jgi:hypothetical protein
VVERLIAASIFNFSVRSPASPKQFSIGHVFDSRWVLSLSTHSSVVERLIAASIFNFSTSLISVYDTAANFLLVDAAPSSSASCCSEAEGLTRCGGDGVNYVLWGRTP